MRRLRIAVTRPLPDGERTAATLRALGHDAVLAPLLRVETIAADLAGTWSALVMTSANAARALADNAETPALRKLPVFVVGARTAAAAQAAGFADVTSADGDGGDLAALIARRCKGARAPVLYLAGADRAFDLEGELRGMDVAAKTVAVYRAVPQPFRPALVEALRGGVDAVLHFSRRSAEAYIAGARGAGIEAAALAPRHLCLSAAVAEPLRAAGADTRVAARPDEAALLDLLESL